MEQERVGDAQEVQELQPVAKQSNFVLVAKSGGIETVIPLEEGQEVVVGGSPECSSCFDDQYISSKHFKAKLVNGCLEVEDLDSTNGLFKKIEKHSQLEIGSHVLAGKTIFSFEQREQEE